MPTPSRQPRRAETETASNASGVPSPRRVAEPALGAAASAGLLALLVAGGGGYEVDERHAGGIAAWLGVVVLLLLGRGAAIARLRPVLVPAALLLCLGLLQGLSAAWSGSAERSVLEADRSIAYLGVFLLAALVAVRRRARGGLLAGLAFAIAAVALVGALDRALPGLTAGDPGALSHPLGYTNATGITCTLGLPLLLVLAAGRSAALRRTATPALPLVLLAVSLTASRGAVLVGLVAIGLLAGLSRDRLAYVALLALALAAAAPAIALAQATGAADATASGGGRAVVLVVLAAGMLAAVAARERGVPRLARSRHWQRALARSRDPRSLRPALAALAVAAAVLLGLAGPRAWEEFTRIDTGPVASEAGFRDLRGGDRLLLWEVAAEAWADEPVGGHGAGAFDFVWDRERPVPRPVRDAHSLYLETFAELGTPGGLLVLALVAALLVVCVRAWRGAAADEREIALAALALTAAFAVAAAFDWLWEVAAAGAVPLLAAGAAAGLLASRERQPAKPSLPAAGAAGAIGLCWLAIAALSPPLLADHQLGRSRAALEDRDVASARAHAVSAADVTPWAASPRVYLAFIEGLAGRPREALRRLKEATRREPRNWELWTLRGYVERRLGLDAAAAASFAEARRLGPAPAGGAGRPRG